MDRGDLFHTLYNAFVKAFPDKKKQQCQADAVVFWNEWKENDREVLEGKVRDKINELEGLLLKKQGKLLQFWGKETVVTPVSATKSRPPAKEPDDITQAPTSSAIKRPAPVQENLKAQLNDVNSQVIFLSDRKSSGLLTDDEHVKLENLKNKKIKLSRKVFKTES